MFELIKGRKQAIWVLLEEKMAIYLCPFILFSYLTLIQNPHDMIYQEPKEFYYVALIHHQRLTDLHFESLRDLFYRRKAFSGLACGGLDWREAYNSAPLHLREQNGVSPILNPIINSIINPNLNPIVNPIMISILNPNR